MQLEYRINSKEQILKIWATIDNSEIELVKRWERYLIPLAQQNKNDLLIHTAQINELYQLQNDTDKDVAELKNEVKSIKRLLGM